jgi:hypothetical protein
MKSARFIAPVERISSALYTETGEGPSTCVRGIREPRTSTASIATGDAGPPAGAGWAAKQAAADKIRAAGSRRTGREREARLRLGMAKSGP